MQFRSKFLEPVEEFHGQLGKVPELPSEDHPDFQTERLRPKLGRGETLGCFWNAAGHSMLRSAVGSCGRTLPKSLVLRGQSPAKIEALALIPCASKERPTFELKLRVAEDFINADHLYFPHNVDFRGRCYPLPPGTQPIVKRNVNTHPIGTGAQATFESHGGRRQPRFANVLRVEAFGTRWTLLVEG